MTKNIKSSREFIFEYELEIYIYKTNKSYILSSSNVTIPYS